MYAKTFTLFALATLALAASGCERVDPDASDTTPPIIEWRVRDVTAGGDHDTYPAFHNLPVTEGHRYWIILAAEDSGGMAWIQLHGSTTFHCQQGDVGSTGQTDEYADDYSMTPDENGQVSDEAIMFDTFDASWNCNGGYTLTGLSRTYTGQARNQAGLVTNAQLVLST